MEKRLVIKKKRKLVKVSDKRSKKSPGYLERHVILSDPGHTKPIKRVENIYL